ncbi:glycoside hydrolase family 18 protein [Chiua virens]|nr:glycoside hydrolase family 18 protein [Chiua virens]
MKHFVDSSIRTDPDFRADIGLGSSINGCELAFNGIMVSLRTGVTAALAAYHLLGSTLAVPLVNKLTSLSPGARDLLKRSTPAAPRFVVYDDAGSSLPSADQLKGYNVFALSFWLTSGAADMALTWQDLSHSQRQKYVQEYNAAGISLIVSAFGETEAPTTNGHDPVDIANKLSSWVFQYGLQGDFGAFDGSSGSAEPWVISLTRQLRTKLPQGEYILTHARAFVTCICKSIADILSTAVAPWFSPNTWSGGGYLKIDQTVGSLIDWYNVQFYNQGANEYKFCSGLLHQSSSDNPESSLFQIAKNGVDINKLVIGKPATSTDADNGYMDTAKLAWCASQAHDAGWSMF